MNRRSTAANLLTLCLTALVLSGCLRARLLHPPSSTTVIHSLPPGTTALNGAGGTLKGQGVTLQASFGLAAPSDLAGHGVRLKVGPAQ